MQSGWVCECTCMLGVQRVGKCIAHGSVLPRSLCPSGIDGGDESYISQSSRHAPNPVLSATNLCVCVWVWVWVCVHMSVSVWGNRFRAKGRKREQEKNSNTVKVLLETDDCSPEGACKGHVHQSHTEILISLICFFFFYSLSLSHAVNSFHTHFTRSSPWTLPIISHRL